MRTIRQFSKKYVGSFLMLLVLIVVTYYFIFRQCNLSQLIDCIVTADGKYLLASIGMVIIYIYCEGLCLNMIGKSLNLAFGRIRSFCYACIDLYYCGITPSATGGQPVLAYYMSKDGVPLSKSTIIILLFTVQYKVVLLFLGIIVYLFHRDFILYNGRGVVLLFVVGIIINVLSISVCLMCMYSKIIIKKLATKLIELLEKLHIVKQKEKKIQTFYSHLEEYHQSADFIKENKKVLLKVFLVTLVQRISMFSVGYLIYRAFDLKQFSFFDILALQVVIAITVDSLPLPGAVGVSEAMFYLLYQIIYSAELMAPAMLLSRGISFYFCLIVCGIIAMVYQLTNLKQRKVLEGE